jgi:hypothetical protein
VTVVRDHTVGEDAVPGLCSDSGFKCVKIGIRVAECHTKKGLPALWARLMKSVLAANTSSSMVSIRLELSGPVSSMRPFAVDLITPRGAIFSRIASLG